MFPFNVRVYGVLADDQKGVLVSDEIIRGKPYTKFPGGGLEWGEGTRECLKREFMEEMALDVEVGEHLYTTDFFQQSAWNEAHQVISIYYYVHAVDANGARQTGLSFDDASIYKGKEHNGEVFRFIPWSDLHEASLTLPIDKVVAGLLSAKHGSRTGGTT